MAHQLRIAYATKVAAALALTGIAHAQSNVTIYGRVDAGITRQNDGTASLSASNGKTGPAGDRWDVRHGSENRLGFLGQEDLGGGLKAGFQLEHRFLIDTGVADPVFWKARSYVYLDSSSLGYVYLGREYVPAFWPAFKLDPFKWDTIGSPSLNHLFGSYRIDGHARANNSVGYKSINYGGLTFSAAVSAGEAVRDSSRGGNVEYTSGPVYLAAAFDRQASTNKMALVGGSYDFGFVKPSVAWVSAEVGGVKATNLTLSATLPVGVHLVKFALARLNPQGADNSITKLGIGYEHLLSKRTSLYTDLGSASQQGMLRGVAYTRTNAVDFGVKHNF